MNKITLCFLKAFYNINVIKQRRKLNMVQGPIQVNSEIGKLKTVLLKRPGKELENLVPDHLSGLLFDDIPYLKVAQEEHDKFAQTLRDEGI
ncbi:arginine deiminase family protein, partial [Cutibacterium acnes]